jgi:hypothetical protein
LNDGIGGIQLSGSYSPSAFASFFAFALRFLPSLVNRFPIETVVFEKTSVFARENGAVQMRRDLFNRHPDLIFLRLSAFGLHFGEAVFDHRTRCRIFGAEF